MIVIPAIDLRGGRAVRLLRGNPEEETSYADDPVAVASRFQEEGARRLHVVDLDAALEQGENREVRARHLPGGRHPGAGRRWRAHDARTSRRCWSLGAARAILGTAAAARPRVRGARGRGIRRARRSSRSTCAAAT